MFLLLLASLCSRARADDVWPGAAAAAAPSDLPWPHGDASFRPPRWADGPPLAIEWTAIARVSTYSLEYRVQFGPHDYRWSEGPFPARGGEAFSVPFSLPEGARLHPSQADHASVLRVRLVVDDGPYGEIATELYLPLREVLFDGTPSGRVFDRLASEGAAAHGISERRLTELRDAGYEPAPGERVSAPLALSSDVPLVAGDVPPPSEVE